MPTCPAGHICGDELQSYTVLYIQLYYYVYNKCSSSAKCLHVLQYKIMRIQVEWSIY